jgi:hypothetical protein
VWAAQKRKRTPCGPPTSTAPRRLDHEDHAGNGIVCNGWHDVVVSEPEDIWQKIERSRAAAGPVAVVQTPAPEAAEGSKKPRVSPKTIIRALDALSVIFWAYVFVKIFIFDVDRTVLRAISTRALVVLDYRVFFWLGIVVVCVLVLRSRSLALVYILVFPLLVVVWKIPAFFIRRKSWAMFLGSLQVVFTALSSFRYNLTTKGLASACAVVIAVSHSRSVLLVAAVYLAWLLVWSYVRLLRRTFTASSFLTVQRRQISRIVTSGPVRSMTSVAEELKSPNVVLYDRTQLTQVANAASAAILVNKGLYYWAYQLERYRRDYSPALIFSALSYVWLFLGTLMSLALMNDALIKALPHEYDVGSHRPSLLAVTLYSLATLFVSSGGGITASGNAAYALQLGAGIAGPFFLAACVLNFTIAFRRERDEGALRALVAELKLRARKQERSFRDEWHVSVDEARRRLEDLGEGLGLLWKYFVQRIPEDFMRD